VGLEELHHFNCSGLLPELKIPFQMPTYPQPLIANLRYPEKKRLFCGKDSIVSVVCGL